MSSRDSGAWVERVVDRMGEKISGSHHRLRSTDCIISHTYVLRVLCEVFLTSKSFEPAYGTLVKSLQSTLEMPLLLDASVGCAQKFQPAVLPHYS